MNTLTHFAGKYLAIAAIFVSSANAFSQARETTATAPAPATGPFDYAKDASSQKLKTHIISFGFFSPINYHISFGYDQLVGTDIVLSTQLGIIGPGINNTGSGNSSYQRPAGLFVEGGAKLFFSPDFVTIGTLRYNSMQGAYFKPQIVFSTFGLTQYNYGYYGNPSTTNTTDHTGVAIMLNMGKQWILAHVISLDMYAGIGYGLSSNNSNYDYVSNYYSYEITTTGIAFTAGLNIGVVF